MRTFSVFIVLFTGVLFHVSAQNITGGLTAKAGISQIIRASVFGQPTNYESLNKFRFAYQVGLYGTFSFSKKSAIGLELLYMRQNGLQEITFEFTDTVSGSIFSGTDKLYMNLGYISLPLYYSFTVSNISLHLGAQGNLLLSQSGKEIFDASGGSDSTHSEKEFDSLNFKNYDVGLNAGIHYVVGKHISFGINYYLGFVNLSNDEATFSAQNQNFCFDIAYRLFSGSTKSEKEQWYTK